MRYSLFLLAVSDYKWLDKSFYFIITNFHTELKHQENVSHYINSPAFAHCMHNHGRRKEVERRIGPFLDF